MKQIQGFSFHEEMTRKGKVHAAEARDLNMMNKIWGSPIAKDSLHLQVPGGHANGRKLNLISIILH